MRSIAVIGYGGMGQWHARHVEESGFACLNGIYDIDPEKLALARGRGVKAYDSLEELLSGGAEVCIIATPNDCHATLAIRCLQAGKHVIVEKPAAMTRAELDSMYDAADAAGRLLSVHQNRRWDADYLALREVIASGHLGRVLNVESRIHGSRGVPSDWRKDPAQGGGMLFDWGVHLIDQMLLLLEGDAPTQVRCTFCHVTENSVDDGFYLTLDFASGARAMIEVNTCNFIAMPRFYLAARDGSAIITDWRENCRVVECFAWSEADVLPEARGAGITKTMAPRDDITTHSYEMPRPALQPMRYLENFCRAVAGEEALIVTREQVTRVFDVITAAFASAAQNGAAVKI